MSLSHEEFNTLLILITLVVSSIAACLLVIAYCRVRCGCCRRKHRPTNSNLPEGIEGSSEKKIEGTSQKPGSDHDFDFIDDRHTNVISSAVRVTSLRNIEEVPV